MYWGLNLGWKCLSLCQILYFNSRGILLFVCLMALCNTCFSVKVCFLQCLLIFSLISQYMAACGHTIIHSERENTGDGSDPHSLSTCKKSGTSLKHPCHIINKHPGKNTDSLQNEAYVTFLQVTVGSKNTSTLTHMQINSSVSFCWDKFPFGRRTNG